MKEALFYKKLEDKKVQCLLCPRGCIIPEGKRGFCKVRENKNGKLNALVYSKPCSIQIDPIEKKPLFHFLPGHKSFSIGTTGCNLACKHCQNYTTSQAEVEEVPGYELTPEKAVTEAIKQDCKSIAYTYNEPSIFYEYVLDTAKLARQSKLKNVTVTNGFINEEPFEKLYKYIDGANVDLKAFDDKFYREITTAWLEPVLNTLKILKKIGTWFEITNLIIPTLNDDLKKIKKMCEWIKENLGVDVPLHFTAFYPTYKLTNLPSTSPEILVKARDIALKVGLHYVYVGNVYIGGAENTYCPKCGKLLIERMGFAILQNRIKNGKCSCGEKIAGVWE